MAKQAAMTAQGKPGIVQRIEVFWEEVRTELSKVTWPTWKDLQVSTNVTLMMLGIMAFIIFWYDWIFQHVVLLLLNWAG